MAYKFTLPSDTFVDPNGDSLTYAVSGVPSWMTYNSSSKTFSGTPKVYGIHTINITATDAWDGSASLTYSIICGIRPNQPPYVNKGLG